MGKSNTDVSRKPNQRSVSDDSQIIDQAIQTKLSDQFRPYYLISAILFIFTLFEWYRWHEDLPPVPFIMSVLFLISAVVAYFKQLKFRQEIGFLSYGKQGERPIAEYITELSKINNIRIFQDIKIGNNICSYVICAKFGVMLIDIINLPTPQNGEAIVAYNNNILTLNGYPMDRDPVYDLKKSSSDLKKILKRSSNKDFSIYGVIVFPNWYVKVHENTDVKIINPRQLIDVCQNLSAHSVDIDQGIVSYHLNKYIRATNQ